MRICNPHNQPDPSLLSMTNTFQPLGKHSSPSSTFYIVILILLFTLKPRPLISIHNVFPTSDPTSILYHPLKQYTKLNTLLQAGKRYIHIDVQSRPYTTSPWPTQPWTLYLIRFIQKPLHWSLVLSNVQKDVTTCRGHENNKNDIGI